MSAACRVGNFMITSRFDAFCLTRMAWCSGRRPIGWTGSALRSSSTGRPVESYWPSCSRRSGRRLPAAVDSAITPCRYWIGG